MPLPTKKRKAEASKIEEISFDPEARSDYLTGFHKRKLQRAKYARDLAEKKAREEKIEGRRRLRQERKENLERHIAEVNAMLHPVDDGEQSENQHSQDEEEDGEDWDGLAEVPKIDHEAEYIDEERYTTVIVEAIDLSREGLDRTEKENHISAGTEDDEQDVAAKPSAKKLGKRVWLKEKPKNDGHTVKNKRKKFRYESKPERKVSRLKQHSEEPINRQRHAEPLDLIVKLSRLSFHLIDRSWYLRWVG